MADETPAPLSDAEIAEIAERATNATPGPWFRHPNGSAWDGVWNGVATLVIANTEHDSDLDFIAAARTDVPRLLARLQWLEEVSREVNTKWLPQHDKMCDEFETLSDEHAELREQMAALERDNAALREMLAEAAVIDRLHPHDPDPWFCDWCRSSASEIEGIGGLTMVHQPDCWYTRARALLATQTPKTGATAGEEGEA